MTGTTSWPSAPAPVVPVGALPDQPARSRVKVLHVITRFWAGAGGNTLLTALGMDQDRYEVWIAGMPGGPLWERAEEAGIRTVKLGRLHETLSPADDAVVLLDLVRLMRHERFTVVHTHSAKAGFLGRLAAKLSRAPVVVHTFHGFPFHDYMSPARRRAYIALDRMVRPMTHGFLAVAPSVAREAVERRLARPGSVTVAPSAVELDAVPERHDGLVRAELKISPSAALIGTVGRIDLQKAPLDFVRMAAIVAKARPGTQFAMVGDGPLEQDARAEAERLGAPVVFTGYRADAPRVAAAFDVFVISSLYEGLGRALTEALASGRPVVATAVNGVPDLVEPGSTGLLAPPGDPEALAQAVIWMLDHPDEARRMGARGRDRVRSTFDAATMCAVIDATYCGLLGLPVSPPVPAESVVVLADHSAALATEHSRHRSELGAAAGHVRVPGRR